MNFFRAENDQDRRPLAHREWLALVFLVLTLGSVLLLAYLRFGGTFSGGKPPWLLIFALVFGLLFAIASFILSPHASLREVGLRGVLRPKWIAASLMMVLAIFGAMSNVLSLFGEPGATEGTADRIDDTTSDTNRIVRERLIDPSEPARIRTALPGVWGFRGCETTFRFEVFDDAVVMRSVAAPAGQVPYRYIGTIVEAEGDRMELRGEAPEASRGGATTLTYETNGLVETLSIDDRTREIQDEFGRCG